MVNNMIHTPVLVTFNVTLSLHAFCNDIFAHSSAFSPSENLRLKTLVSRIGFLSALPMDCPSKSLTLDLTVPEAMSFLFGKTTSAPMYVSYVMGVGSSTNSLACTILPPSSSSYSSYSGVEYTSSKSCMVADAPSLCITFGHMILASFSPLGCSLHPQLSACMMTHTHTSIYFRNFAHNAGPISVLGPSHLPKTTCHEGMLQHCL